MSVTEFSSALNQISSERGIPIDSIIEAIETALIAAYRKDFPQAPSVNLFAKVDRETGEAKIYEQMDDEEPKDVTPPGFGRIAAQTAKQVILQKIRESEKDAIIEEFRGKIGTVMSGHIFRIEKGAITIDLVRAHGIMPYKEQIPHEEYRINQRLKVLVKDIRQGQKGPEVIVSRSDPDFVRELFALEVPEIASGVVVIESIAREAGSRTKLAVSSKDEKIDPIGSCVGQKGVRVQSVINEIGMEKIDIIPYYPQREKFIAASLSPAKVTEVILNEETKEARVDVPEDQLSLAIGKEGQNVRLAAKLTGWKIDIKGYGEDGKIIENRKSAKDEKNEDKGKDKEELQVEEKIKEGSEKGKKKDKKEESGESVKKKKKSAKKKDAEK